MYDLILPLLFGFVVGIIFSFHISKRDIKKTLDSLGIYIIFPGKPKLKIYGNEGSGSYNLNFKADKNTNYNVMVFSQKNMNDEEFEEFSDHLISEMDDSEIGELVADDVITINKIQGTEKEVLFNIDGFHDRYCKQWTFIKDNKIIFVSYAQTIDAGSALAPDKEFFKSFKFIK